MPQLLKALILAAGLGSRLQDKTVNCPKALVPVHGKPILAYQMEALQTINVHDIGIVVGYQAKKILEFISSEYPRMNVCYFNNPDYETTNSAYSFWQAREWVQGDSAIHLNCDILFSQNLLKQLLSSPHENMIAIRTDVPLGGRLEHVTLQGDRITHMSLERTPQAVGKAFGLAKFGPAHFDFVCRYIEKHLQDGVKKEHYYGIIREAVAVLDYHALMAPPDCLLEVNTIEDLQVAKKVVSLREIF